VFTARYALSPYIKQIRFVFKGLIKHLIFTTIITVGTVTAITRVSSVSKVTLCFCVAATRISLIYPSYHYRKQETCKYVVASSGKTFLSNFNKPRPAFSNLEYLDWQKSGVSYKQSFFCRMQKLIITA
jgi:hypothetical protein